jgi:phosphoribosyl-ATP pyrophosphohydrolase/phosphoribosyl-AMP cyclohydrolase
MSKDIAPKGMANEVFSLLRWDLNGLITVVVQEQSTGEVLMVAHANKEALKQTLLTKRATFFSRSRNAIWVKGETSGYEQSVQEVRVDCDGDCVLYSVSAPGPACHQLRRSCFSNRVDDDGSVRCDKPTIA